MDAESLLRNPVWRSSARPLFVRCDLDTPKRNCDEAFRQLLPISLQLRCSMHIIVFSLLPEVILLLRYVNLGENANYQGWTVNFWGIGLTLQYSARNSAPVKFDMKAS
ncbi:hypothetical protein EVAR_84748_1 [Eumeta japonica]|uniref:Uncharacterized protein n=1 Tax=Eumeta variegata TaxID=151549 RepID=A0A4C1VU84_EUMVA|nr:hypothetical protein EVAR_84748_1 [Eumeta japonica]